VVEKNIKKLKAKKQRVICEMNMGTRIHKDAKHPSRQQEKQKLKGEW